MKWDTIKTKVAQGMYDEIVLMRNEDANFAALFIQVDPSSRMKLDEIRARYKTSNRHYGHLVKFAEAVRDIILGFDVRKVGALRELFPQHFPKSLREGELVAYIEDSEESPWVVERRAS